jgi:hypothetical protein
MRRGKYNPVFVPPKVVVDPITGESKLNTNRWTSFGVDIKAESRKFKAVLDRAKSDSRQVNTEFATCAQSSFNAIHNVRRTQVHEDDGVFRAKPAEAASGGLALPSFG